jgi:hypothetical protein
MMSLDLSGEDPGWINRSARLADSESSEGS